MGVQGNPLCLQTDYIAAVQQHLPNLQHFDGSPVSRQPTHAKTHIASSTAANTAPDLSSPAKAPSPQPELQHSHPTAPLTKSPPAAVQSGLKLKPQHAQQPTEIDSIAALHASFSDGSTPPLQLQVQLSQLTVSSATPAEAIPIADSSSGEAQPPLCYYYLQLRSVTFRHILECPPVAIKVSLIALISPREALSAQTILHDVCYKSIRTSPSTTLHTVKDSQGAPNL